MRPGSERVVGAGEEPIDTEEVGRLRSRGCSRPVSTFNVGRLKASALKSHLSRGRALNTLGPRAAKPGEAMSHGDGQG